MNGSLQARAAALLRRGVRALLGQRERTPLPDGSFVEVDPSRTSRRPGARTSTSRPMRGTERPRNARHPAPVPRTGPAAVPYPGDWPGDPRELDLSYQAREDDDADAGEVVWAWVPYEEDHTRGKDRPVLVIARQGAHLLALQLTSKDHDRDTAQEARQGRYWMDVGSGAWDRRGRPSEVRLDRVLLIDPRAIRREGAALEPAIFAAVADRLHRGW